MKHNLKLATDWILVHEGGYVNHPKDPGGATNMGVIQRTYDGWRARKNKPLQTVRNITSAEVVSIYKDQYWDKVWGDQLPEGLDYAMYDFAINSGPGRAIKYIQELVGVNADGVMGNITFDAIRKENDMEQLIIDLCYKRWAFLKRLRHFSTFGRGWTRRVMGETEGVQDRDHGVIDRGVMLYKNQQNIPAPKKVDDESGQRTSEVEQLTRVEDLKAGVNIDNLVKVGIGSVPAFYGAAVSAPEGPIQWAFAVVGVGMFLFVAWWAAKRLV